MLKSVLFTKSRINGLVLANRFVRSATYEALANESGCSTPAVEKCYTDYADGEVGLIISSCTQVDPHSKHHPTMLSVTSDDAVQSLGILAQRVHEHRAPLAIQLTHSGVASKESLTHLKPEVPDTVSHHDIERIVANFVKGAKACVGVGIDAVQIHSAGRYLLGSFLMPEFNHRTDEFGGNAKNRAEIVRRVVEAVRKAVPTSYPVMIKLSASREMGVKPEDVVETVKIIENAGIDAVELSLGAISGEKDLDAVKEVRKVSKVPLMVCGGYRDVKEMEKAVEDGLFDYVSLSRPLIRQPKLVKMFHEGITQMASCKQCNGCMQWTSVQEKPLKCVSKT